MADCLEFKEAWEKRFDCATIPSLNVFVLNLELTVFFFFFHFLRRVSMDCLV